jgi:hypothetical protein
MAPELGQNPLKTGPNRCFIVKIKPKLLMCSAIEKIMGNTFLVLKPVQSIHM